MDSGIEQTFIERTYGSPITPPGAGAAAGRILTHEVKQCKNVKFIFGTATYIIQFEKFFGGTVLHFNPFCIILVNTKMTGGDKNAKTGKKGQSLMGTVSDMHTPGQGGN